MFSQHDAEPLCDRLLAAGLPAGPVQSIDQALTNAHTVHRGDIIEKDWYKGVASPIRLERSKPSLRRVPPKFSQHTAEVLGEFGYSEAEIDALVAKGVVCGANASASSRHCRPCECERRGPIIPGVSCGPRCLPPCPNDRPRRWIPARAHKRSLGRDDRRDHRHVFSGFPCRALPQYHAFAYTVICTSSSAVIAQNEDDGPNREEFRWLFDNSAQQRRAVTAALALATPAHAVTELQWWHAMTGGNNDVVNKLAADFNASQSDYKVVPSYKGGYADTMNAGIAAFRAGNAPHIMQVFEVGTATMMSATGAIKPVYQLMKDAGEPFDPKAYLPTITGYYSTSKGEMLSFPFNSSSTVMWINKDELKKAGIADIPKTWPEVFDAAKKLKAAGHDTCGFSNAWATWVHIEQFSAWHNVPIGIQGERPRRLRHRARSSTRRCTSSTCRT